MGGERIPVLADVLDGIVDIYMPDFKFWDPEIAASACDARNYPEVTRRALIEMHRQVGDLAINKNGIAQRGLLIRHLVLPQGLAGTREVMRFIATKISTNSYVNIMSQYRPCGRAAEINGLATYPSRTDFQAAVKAAKQEGITRLDQPRRVFVLG